MANPFTKLEEQVKCPVCLEVFKQPKSLVCSHALCLDCINNLPVDVDEGKHKVRCPTCRKQTTLPKNSVANLPSAFYLNTLIELLNQGTQSLQASHVDCPKHGRPLEMFCVDCQLTVCAKCFVGGHRDHNCDFVTDIIDQYQQEIGGRLAGVKQQIGYVLSTIDSLNAQETKVTQCGEKVKREIDELVHEIIRVVQKSGVQLKKRVDEIVQQELNKISKQREDRQTSVKHLGITMEYIEEKLQSKSSELLKEKDQMIKKLENISKEVKLEKLELKEPVDFVFQRKQAIIESNATIGKVSYSDTTQPADNVCGTVRVIKQLSLKTFKQITAIKGIRRPRGIALPSSGLLVVAESEDNTLAVIQRSTLSGGYSKPERIPLQQGVCPEAVCTTTDGHILVVGNTAPYIIRYKTNYSTVIHAVNSTSSIGPYQYHWLRDVAVGPSGKVYISDWNNHCIHVLQADLTFSKSIGKRGNKPSQFKWPWGIATTPDTVYVCDRDNSRIQKFSMDDQYVGEFSVSSRPQHIAVGNGILYITSDNGMVTAYSVEGDCLAQVALKDCDNIAIDEQGLIYVCNYMENKIAVFNGLL